MGMILNGSGLSQVSEGGSEARPTPHMNAPFWGMGSGAQRRVVHGLDPRDDDDVGLTRPRAISTAR